MERKIAWLIICLLAIFIYQNFSQHQKVAEALQTSIFSTNPVYTTHLKELNHQEYPDDPDIPKQHTSYLSNEFSAIQFKEVEQGVFNIVAIPEKSTDDLLTFTQINLMEFIPTIPTYLGEDAYLRKICIVNQEWNRNQIALPLGEQQYQLSGQQVTRVDLARNCLNSYLWELIAYTHEEGVKKVLYHGWFDFPKKLYARLFEERNGDSFAIYKEHLEQWKDMENKPIDLANFRAVIEEQTVPFEVQNKDMYPLEGERQKKEMAIITPRHYTCMQDFLSDETTFATFSPPGCYRKEEPRKTELSRFMNLQQVKQRTTVNVTTKTDHTELELTFQCPKGKITKLIIGGLNKETLPTLPVADANKGQMYSMGIGNRPFYETYEEQQQQSSKTNTYFGVLTDEKDNWLDSHQVGIDGPLFHFDEQGKLHLWLLSFERHALVGHFIIELGEDIKG